MAVDLPIRERFTHWTWLTILLLPALAVLIWAGSSDDPRRAIPWTWTKTGWIVPASGLSSLWISSAILFTLLSAIAYLLFYPRPVTFQLRPWARLVLILKLAIISRILIACIWIALPLHPILLSAKSLPTSTSLHALAIVADIFVVGLLLVVLHANGRSLWWAALYALHPLALIEIAGNGHWISFALLPLVLVAGLSHRFDRSLKFAFAGLLAFASVCLVYVLGANPAFNSFSAELVVDLGAPPRIILPAVTAVLQGFVLFLAARRDWPLPRTFAHMVLIFLICSPVVQPWYVLPLLALVPFAWTRAGWVVSILVLAAYGAVVLLRAKEPWQVPSWLLMLEWMPVIVLEAQELLAESFIKNPSLAGASADAAPTVP